MGMAIVFSNSLGVIYEWGFGKALVRTYDPASPRDATTFFSVSLLISGVATLLLLAIAPFVARFYGEPRLTAILAVLSLTLIPSGLKTVSASLLTRDLRFRDASVSDVWATVLSGATAIVLAALGCGVWSLVANLVLFYGLQMLFYARYFPPAFTWHPDKAVTIKLTKFAVPVLGSSALACVYNNADNVIVGKLLGAGPLGFYSLAFRLAGLINDRISGVINSVAYPTFALLREDPEAMIKHWFAVTKRVTVLTFPLLAWLAVNADDFVNVVLGPKWSPASFPLRFLCAAMTVRILTNVVGQILTAAGHPEIVFRHDLLLAIALGVGFWIAIKIYGFAGAAVVWCTVYPAIRVLFLWDARRVLHFKVADYALNLLPAMLLTVNGLIAMLATRTFLGPGFERLLLSSSVWLVVSGACIFLFSDLRLMITTMFNPAGLFSRTTEREDGR